MAKTITPQSCDQENAPRTGAGWNQLKQFPMSSLAAVSQYPAALFRLTSSSTLVVKTTDFSLFNTGVSIKFEVGSQFEKSRRRY